ncbi:ABC transporter substrate-binding protein [Biformimicrobium ophioploci]|uniref:Fe/B12 periplasmic-binding domain-containing protein n=1 Tax=Biformimicrobium ophioploci TaxID=3036711 RepID=A0ABQ6M116_9GAMM|nr:ABC transporter substrate-binding protein [Microbulbifer sp. NKW57]GMG88013.1 hypothetical protein MNKW57_23340 [Microbulbifer sp. NKW57]
MQSLLLFLFALSFSLSGEARPERIASLNLCLDQLLLELVPHEHIVSLTWLAADPRYGNRDIPDHIRLNHGRAEELLPLQPDLVLVGQYGAGRAAQFLKGLGVRVEAIADPADIDGIYRQVNALGELTGRAAAAQAYTRALQKTLGPLKVAGPRPKVVVYSPNGIVMGKGMLENQLLELAGFDNLAARAGVEYVKPVSLESVLDWQPDALIIAGVYPQFSLANVPLRHRALLRAYPEEKRFYMPPELGQCPAAIAGGVVEKLREFRQRIK